MPRPKLKTGVERYPMRRNVLSDFGIRVFRPFFRGVGAAILAGLAAGLPGFTRAAAQEEDARVIDLTLERMVELTMSRSYQVRQLNLSIQRDRYNLQAEQARLKSSVDLDLTVPSFRLTSEPKWNSVLERNEIVQENRRMWEGELAVRQPVILFGYPTNGYLSFNNRMYRYLQIKVNGDEDVRYYNRYFIRYTQPLFQPNALKNNLEKAELSLESSQLDFYDDVVGIVDNVSGDYFDLFEDAYEAVISRGLVESLERTLRLSRELSRADSARSTDVDQVQVELANAMEQVQRSESAFRLRSSGIKQRLGLLETDSIYLEPVFRLDPVHIDVDDATRRALELTPRMRQLDIRLRESEIRLEETKGRGGFRMDLSLSYGRERQDPVFDRIWVDPDNSYTVDVRAYLPLWDWGGRSARIASSRIGIDQTRLRMEEAEIQLVARVRNEVLNVREFQNRTLAMMENLELARAVSASSFRRYQDGAIGAFELVQSLRREADTANNFLDAYIGWRKTLLRLQRLTYYDFENDTSVLEHFGLVGELNGNGIATPGGGN
jgi:outer membrane protein TolC